MGKQRISDARLPAAETRTPFDRAPDRIGAKRNLPRIRRWARDGEQKRGRIAEISYERRRSGTGRKNAERGQASSDIVERLARLPQMARKRKSDDRNVGPGNGFDARDRGLRRDGLFDRLSDQLLYFFGILAGPRRNHNRLLVGNVGIPALGHRDIAVDSPNTDRRQRDPRDLAILHEEAREIAGMRSGAWILH